MKTFQVTLSPSCEVVRVKASSIEEVQESCLNPPVIISEIVDLNMGETTEPTLETQRDEVGVEAFGLSWERQVDMNGDVYIREDEDYLDRD